MADQTNDQGRHDNSEVLEAIRDLGKIIKQQGEQMSIDLTKLQAADAALGQEITTLATTVQTEATVIQSAINALAALNVADPVAQAAVDAVTADLTTSAANLNASISGVQGLPTAPTPPPASAKRK